MPVEHHYTIRAGTTSKLLLFHAVDANDPSAGRTGLTHDSARSTAAYFREGDSAARRLPLTAGRLGEWAPGALTEVDPDLMPGAYQLGAPDEMLAKGSTRVLLSLRFDGALVKPVEISLVAYDPQDAERMGVWGLANSKRHEFLRQALPRFTEMELALGEQAEQELGRRLSESEDA